MMNLVPFLAIKYPNTPWALRFVLFIPKKAFFSIFEEFFLDEIQDGGRPIQKDSHLTVKRSASDVSVRSHHSGKPGDNENGDIGLKPLNRGDLLVKSRSRTDLLKLNRIELVPPNDDADCSSVNDDTDIYIEDDFETEVESMGDFECFMGEIHLAVRPDVNIRGRKNEQTDRRPISVIRPTIRMKKIESRETEA